MVYHHRFSETTGGSCNIYLCTAILHTEILHLCLHEKWMTEGQFCAEEIIIGFVNLSFFVKSVIVIAINLVEKAACL